MLWNRDYAANSYATRQECQQEADRLTEENKTYMSKHPAKNWVEMIVRSVSYRCFPDTFDPRGPKGN